MYIKLIRFPLLWKRFGSSPLFLRNKGTLGLWHDDLNTDIKINIEKHWSDDILITSKTNKLNESHYVLPMFPYPSGNLHMGHVRVYTLSDTIARFQNLKGKNVIHPIGWDAFGLPAENAAIERNIPPDEWTNTNIDTMRKQLHKLGYNFDWTREFSTCNPKYYKWTQYIFLKLFEQGLAYQRKAIVNWDPVDKTVLADEQVDEFGCSWRSGAQVEKKSLTQWYIKTTKFAKQLYDGLNGKNLENWGDIINLQKHWIGECNGVAVTFTINAGNEMRSFDVWTSEPYKFIHGKFITMTKSNVIVQEALDAGFDVLKAYNPITNCDLPIYVTDDVTYPEGRDVYLACPQWDESDRTLAHALNFPVVEENGTFDIDFQNKQALNEAETKNVDYHNVSSKLKDWLISRQRYWGTPIPIIHCEDCGPVPVPFEDLPVTLPGKTVCKTGIQTLDKIDDWVNCKCPKCQSNARRETDTMDTFVDSSWYYYRFLDPHNENMPFNKKQVTGNAPVHLYIGGKEHAVLHLYYARFMSYFLNSLGWTPTAEPFKKLLVQGMVMGQSYKVKSTGKYIPPNCVETVGKTYKEKETGEPVLVQWEKMSKSKYNGENPERLLELYGCDTTRLLMLSDVPPATERLWSDATLPGVLNWQHRLWLSMREFLKHRSYLELENMTEEELKKFESKIWESRNYFIATATYHFQYTHKISVAISRLQSLTNTLRNKIPPQVVARSKEFEIALGQLIIMLSPVTPHFCSELWAGFTSAPNRINSDNSFIWDKSVLDQVWPSVDDHFKLSFLCKVDGKDRCDLKVNAHILNELCEEEAIRMMLNEEAVAKRIKNAILRTKYELYPDCRAILHIYTDRKLKQTPKLKDKENISAAQQI